MERPETVAAAGRERGACPHGYASRSASTKQGQARCPKASLRADDGSGSSLAGVRARRGRVIRPPGLPSMCRTTRYRISMMSLIRWHRRALELSFRPSSSIPVIATGTPGRNLTPVNMHRE